MRQTQSQKHRARHGRSRRSEVTVTAHGPDGEVSVAVSDPVSPNGSNGRSQPAPGIDAVASPRANGNGSKRQKDAPKVTGNGSNGHSLDGNGQKTNGNGHKAHTNGNGDKTNGNGGGSPLRLDAYADDAIVVRSLQPRPATQRTNGQLRRGIMAARVLLDLLAIAFSLGLATAVRFGPDAIGATGTPEPYGRLLPMWLPLWWGGLIAAGCYDRLRTENPAEELRRLLHGVTLGALATVVFSFSTGFHLSRTWLFIAVASGIVTVTAGRYVMRKVLHRARRRGLLRRPVLIVGADASGKALAKSVTTAPWEGLDVIGYVSVNGQVGDGLGGDDLILGTVDRLRDLIVRLQIAEVLVAPTVAGNGHLSEVVSALDGVAVDLRIATGIEGFLTSRLTFQPLGDRPLVSVERNELQPAARVLKRILDLVLAGGLIIATAPVMAAAAIAIKLDTKGPVFFRQRRVGIGGKEFRIWKLRSMVADAEELKKVLQARNEADGLLFKMTDDPRITRVGRIIRKTCIDELPQLFNVLAGHMSLVGPRPPLPEEVARYDKRIGRRLLVRPGLTGLWQINGRHELAFEDYIRFDLLYVQNWSLALDLYILAKTLPAVVAGRGAS